MGSITVFGTTFIVMYSHQSGAYLAGYNYGTSKRISLTRLDTELNEHSEDCHNQIEERKHRAKQGSEELGEKPRRM